MPQANVDLVLSVFEGWRLGDFSGAEAFDPEVQFEMPDWPHPVSSRGLPEMRNAWVSTLSAWESFRAEAGKVIEVGDQVVVLTRIVGRGQGSGAEVTAETATVWTIGAGKVVRLALYWDRALAFEALGLRE